MHAPVTAVQLSRGKAEAQLLFECALLMQDLGRLAADLLLFYTQEFAFVTLPESFTTGSSIMPQKRNPDVFELVRGRSAVAHACLIGGAGHFREAAVGLSARPAAHQAAAVPRNRPRVVHRRHHGDRAWMACVSAPAQIRLDPAIHAAEEANALVVREGIPFREAYRRIGEKYRK